MSPAVRSACHTIRRISRRRGEAVAASICDKSERCVGVPNGIFKIILDKTKIFVCGFCAIPNSRSLRLAAALHQQSVEGKMSKQALVGLASAVLLLAGCSRQADQSPSAQRPSPKPVDRSAAAPVAYTQ